MTLKIEAATQETAKLLTLRDSDVRELALVHPGKAPFDAVMESIAVSKQAWIALNMDGPVAVFGYAVNDSLLVPWMLCDKRVSQHGRDALRLGAAWVALFKKEAGPRQVSNWIAKDNASARRFIQRLGFVIEPRPDVPNFDFFFLP